MSSTSRRLVRRLLVVLAALIIVGYGAASVWLMSQETRLVFKAGRQLGPARPTTPFEQVDLPRPDGLHQFAWIMSNADDATERP